MKKSNYKILMISINNVWRYGNIGLDQLTGYLRMRGFSVDINYFGKTDTAEEIFNKIGKDYDFYGFSVTIANYKRCCLIADYIKRINPSAVIDFGGGYVTRYFREVFQENNSVDFITLGDGEIPTELLLNSLINYQLSKEEIEVNHYAIVTRNSQSGKFPYLNEEITWEPAYDYYENDTPIRNARKIHCIQTKNNVCTGNCSFCTERHGKIAYKSIDSIIEQITHVYHNYGVKKIFFTDDNILDPNNKEAKYRLKELCFKIQNLGYKLAFQCYIKAISLSDTLEDNELLSLMKQVGFVEVFVGVESGNNEDLLLYNKHTTVSDNYTVLRILQKHNLTPILGFIGFNPYSSFEKIKKNFQFLCDVKCTYLFNYLHCFVNINRYTEIYEKANKDALIINDGSYVNIKYAYKDKTIIPIVKYIEEEMVPRLNNMEYDLDWITYATREYQIWYGGQEKILRKLESLKEEDLKFIKNKLGILFIKNDLEGFKKIENEFWNYFESRQEFFAKIYKNLVLLHEKNLTGKD